MKRLDNYLNIKSLTWLMASLLAMFVAGCGGGGGGGDAAPASGTLGVSMTDSPACGFDAVNVTVGQNTTSFSAGVPSATIASGADYPQSSTMNTSAGAFGTQTVNSGYTAKVIIVYTDLSSNFQYTTTGTLTGKVS